MTPGPERHEVELPLVEQLVRMGWKHTTGNLDDPSATARSSFREVLLLDDLRKALRRINLDDSGAPWLDDDRIDQAIHAIQRPGATKLQEANQRVTELLHAGTVVDGVPGWDKGRGRLVHYIDWEHPENNTYRVIDQFKVECPGGQTVKNIVPDLVLFVNGIPLAVVECKSPTLAAPMEEAIDQLRRYSNQRTRVADPEGNERLFHPNQLLIATSFDEARVGTIGASAAHYREWKDTSPVPAAEVARELGKAELSSQETLAAGMLRPAHLLDIVRHFTLFKTAGGRTIKVVPRYQQFRAVRAALERLLTGKTRLEDGEHDRRGGIVWHTQGSGKSLSMVFLVRALRSEPELRRSKVVVVTDRKDLERQLSETAHLTCENVRIARSAAEAKAILSEKGPDLVFVMIQKYRTGEGEGADGGAAEELPEFPVLNEDESILVLVDEAHRSHTNVSHAHLLQGLPNCARIGFTGTPIIMGAKQRTHEIFGEYIDRYTIQQSEEDGATVPIIYEGRTDEGAVVDPAGLDSRFEDLFPELTEAEREAIRRKYGTTGNLTEAKEIIASKARDMLRHYIDRVLPNGFKAMLVSSSRLAAVRYFEALDAARDELVAEIEAFGAGSLERGRDEPEEAFERRQELLERAAEHLGTIRALEFAPVISGDGNDDPAWAEWSDGAKQERRIERFKKPLVDEDPDRADPLAFLIVKSMLLTGFDAPIAQVMYLDRKIQEAELLQAIARVNRTHDGKQAGLVVDYYGVANHLEAALEAYSDEDVEGALQDIREQLPLLRDRHRRIVQFFERQNVEDTAPLSRYELRTLDRLFRRWQHGRVGNSSRAALLGDGSSSQAREVIELFSRFLATPAAQDPEHYERLCEKVIRPIRGFVREDFEGGEAKDAVDQLMLQVEPFLAKLLALLEPEKYAEILGGGKRAGLGQLIRVLVKCGRIPYDLELSDEEFKAEEGWGERTSYENALRDCMAKRLDAAHRAMDTEERLWQSPVALLLGLIDHNKADLASLPEPPPFDTEDKESCITLLRDDRLRAEFHVLLREFMETLDVVLPRPEGLPYVQDAKRWSEIQLRARNRYHDHDPVIGRDVGERVRDLIDEHVRATGVEVRIDPIALFDAAFSEHMARQANPRARASEMEHAVRRHLRRNLQEQDPELFERFSERLQRILEEHEERWDDLVQALLEFREEIREGRSEEDDGTGLDPVTQAPFLGVLQQERRKTGVASEDMTEKLCRLTVEIVEHIQQEIRIVEFWDKAQAREQLRGWLFQTLDDSDLYQYDQLEGVAERLMELARANHDRLTR